MQFYGQLIVIAVFLGIFYLLVIRPQSVRQRERRQLVESLKKGDEVITVGGIIGTIKAIDEETMVIKTGDVELKMSKTSVGSKIGPKQ